MYPQLINQASRLAPMLSRVLARGGSFATPFWKTSQVDVPEVTAKPMSPVDQPTGPSVPVSLSNFGTPTNYSAPPQPKAAEASALDGAPWPYGPVGKPEASPLDTMNWPFGPNGRPSTPSSSVVSRAVTPTPTPRPTEAPQADPEMSFFQRNAAMMRDPVTGTFIDPTGAAKAVRGPDLINKMMAYLHDKEIG